MKNNIVLTLSTQPSKALESSEHNLTWKEELTESLRRSHQLAQNPNETEWLSLSNTDQERVEAAKKRFPFMIPIDYAELINWEDPTDP